MNYPLKKLTLAVLLSAMSIPVAHGFDVSGWLWKSSVQEDLPIEPQPEAAPLQTSIGIIKLHQDIELPGAEQILRQVIAYSERSDIDGVLLMIDSGGGDAGASELLFREIQLLALNKPVVVVIVSMCCSGAYLTATGAHWIVTPAGSTVGSIGCLRTIEKHTNTRVNNNSGYCADIAYEILQAGRFKTITHPRTGPLTDEDRALLQAELDSDYQLLCTTVAQQRNISIDDISAWADGKKFSGKQALKLGLVDQIGGYSDAVKKLVALIAESNDGQIGTLKFVE